MIRHRSVLEYQHFRYFKVALVLVLAAGIAYWWHEPPLKPYGGTWLGYTLGTVGAALILWLTWFGMRKRRYRSRMGTVQGWLSAHIYLGGALLVIATLHTGFEFGANIHTLAFVLMVIVIFSGFYGVFVYVRVPPAMTVNLGEDTLDSMLQRVADLDREIQRGALSLPDEVLQVVDRSVKGTRLGGSFLRIVSGSDPNCPTARAVKFLPEMTKRLTGDRAQANREVYALVLEKHELLQRMRADLRYKALLDLWLYVHVPFAVALLAALAAHIISVFVYW